MSLQSMADQPRYEAYEGSGSLPAGQSAQSLVPGTVPRGQLNEDLLLNTGRTPEGAPAEVFPFPITRALIERGQERYDIYCTPCHDVLGTGQGVVVQAGFPPPPSFHTDELRAAPVGHFFEVITHGQGDMPGFAEQIPVADRWAIIAYLRALQLSQHAPPEAVPSRLNEEVAP